MKIYSGEKYFQSQRLITLLNSLTESLVLTNMTRYSILCSLWSRRQSVAPLAMYYVVFLHRGMRSGHGKVLDNVVGPNTSEICSLRHQQGIQVCGVYPHTHTHTLSHNPSKCCVNIQGKGLGECSHCQQCLAEVWSHETKWVRFTASHTQTAVFCGSSLFFHRHQTLQWS